MPENMDTEAMARNFVRNVTLIGREMCMLGVIEREAGVTPGYLSRIRAAGRANLSLPTALRLAEATKRVYGFDAPLVSLFGSLLAADYADALLDAEIEAMEKELAALKARRKGEGE